MRILASLLNVATLGLAAGSDDGDCLDRQIRLWLHIDMTGSFNGWRNKYIGSLNDAIKDLAAKYVNLKVGVSGFGDRPNGGDAVDVPGQKDNQCYIPVNNFGDDLDQYFYSRIKNTMEGHQYPGYEDDNEDPLSAMPWVAKNHFGDYTDYELRIFTILTDNGPHYGPKYKCDGHDEPVKPAEDFVTCDKTKRYATLDELFDPIKTRRIFPLITVYPQSGCVEEWTQVLESVHYDASLQLVDMTDDFDPQKFIDAVQTVIDSNACSPAPTVAPHDGTVPTDPASSTTTTTVPTTTATTTTAPVTDAPTEKPTTSTESAGTSKAAGSKTPVLVGAGAGVAALLAAAGAYNLYPGASPPIDVEEGEFGAETSTTGPDRETAVRMNEDAYQ